MSSSSQDLLDSASSTVSTASATITSSTADLLGSDNLADDPSDQSSEVGNVHSHLVAVQPNIEGLSADTLQVNSQKSLKICGLFCERRALKKGDKAFFVLFCYIDGQ